jgi:hypothetical protein
VVADVDEVVVAMADVNVVVDIVVRAVVDVEVIVVAGMDVDVVVDVWLLPAPSRAQPPAKRPIDRIRHATGKRARARLRAASFSYSLEPLATRARGGWPRATALPRAALVTTHREDEAIS